MHRVTYLKTSVLCVTFTLLKIYSKFKMAIKNKDFYDMIII